MAIDLEIRKANKKDKTPLIKFIKEGGMFVPGIRYKEFYVIYRGENMIAAARFKTHDKGKIHELSNFSVKEGWRNCGIGSFVLEKIFDKAKFDTYLNTVNPNFYKKLGFIQIKDVPKPLKKNRVWCKGCDKDLCTTMVKKIKN